MDDPEQSYAVGISYLKEDGKLIDESVMDGI
jgi:hypothetical protein